MAVKVQTKSLGIDVAKDWLDISDGDQVIRISNTRTEIKRFLKTLVDPVAIAIESTSYYHEEFIECAIKDYPLYVVNAFRLSRYREAVGIRIKTDLVDAHLLYRYIEAEKAHLRPFKEIPKAIKALNRLLKARAKLAKTKGMIAQSLDHIGELKQEKKSLIQHLDKTMNSIVKRIEKHIEKAGYQEDYKRCLGIPGVGELNAANLLAIYHRGDFRRADSFIAFMGLDVRIRESGYYRGKRKLTKRGDPETRRLLFNAARSASRTPVWNTYYLSMRERGHSTTAAAVALSRKIARLAFALLRDQSEFIDPCAKKA